MHCPWDNWRLGELGFCEAQLCSWVKQPGNTGSNLAYIIVGIWILKRARKDRCTGLNLFAIATLITGCGSAFFHASGTLFGQSLDYLGMFLESGAMTALNFRRWKNLSWSYIYLIFISTTLLLSISSTIFPNYSRWIYTFGSPCYLIELHLFYHYRKQINYRYFIYSSILMTLGIVFWSLDLSNGYCNPENHFFSGHSLWHLLSAGSIAMLYFFYSQFASIRKS